MAQVSNYKMKSSDNEHTIVMTVWTPETRKPKGVIQIVHGMREHVGRYGDFAKYLCGSGYIVCGHDHIGHGRSALIYGSFGYFGEQDGAKVLVDDTIGVTRYLKYKYADLPLFILGHSMGSFISRIAAVRSASIIDGLILTGTGGASVVTPVLRVYTELLSDIQGPSRNNYISDKIFTSYVGRELFKYEKKDAWISRDKQTVSRFERDPLTHFSFTNQGYSDLLDLLIASNSNTWYKNFAKNMPIIMLSGTQDPIGGFGMDVPDIAKKLKEHGIRNVNYRLYPGARHELLNEINKEEIYAYILNWLNYHINI